MEIKSLAVIAARGGSKRIKNKNVKLLAGKPLVSYVIEAAQKAKYIDKVMVSTDSKEIATVAKKYKADVPFMRPLKLASDTAKSYDVVRHAVEFYEKKQEIYDIIVLIQPTAPLVTSQDIDQAIATLIRTKTNSCVTMCEISDRPEWMFNIKNNLARPFSNFSEGVRSQNFPPLYRINGGVYVIKKELILSNGKLIDEQSLSAVIMPKERSIDIDESFDFELAKLVIKKYKQ